MFAALCACFIVVCVLSLAACCAHSTHMHAMTASRVVAAALLVLVLAAAPAHGLYFNIQEGTPRCFTESLPGYVRFVATYSNLDWKAPVDGQPHTVRRL